MFEVGVIERFEAAHRLKGDFGPATRTHGHTYRVEVTVRGPALRADGTLCDIAMLQATVRRELDELHFRDLDDLPAFAGRNSTAETVAAHLFDRVKAALRRDGLESLDVRIWESPAAFAAFGGPLS